MDDVAWGSVIDSAEMAPMACGSHPACPSWSVFHLHRDNHERALEASLPAHLAFVPVAWCLIPVFCLDVAEVDTTRLRPCKQPKCAPTLWHSCLVQKKNRAGKANISGSLSGSILLPLIFSWCAGFYLEEANRGWNTTLNARLYLHFTWHGVLGPCDSGQEISSSESQLHTQKRRQSFLLHCAAAKEKLIKDCFSFGTISSKGGEKKQW